MNLLKATVLKRVQIEKEEIIRENRLKLLKNFLSNVIKELSDIEILKEECFFSLKYDDGFYVYFISNKGKIYIRIASDLFNYNCRYEIKEKDDNEIIELLEKLETIPRLQLDYMLEDLNYIASTEVKDFNRNNLHSLGRFNIA